MQTQRNDKRRPRVPMACAALIAAAVLTACGGGAALVVPFFTFGFGFSGNVGGAQHTVSLNLAPNAPPSATGQFEAAGSNISIDFVQHDLQGSYSECTLTITVPTAVAPLATSYSGRFTGKDVIELTPTAPAQQPPLPVLTLTRSFGTDDRAMTC